MEACQEAPQPNRPKRTYFKLEIRPNVDGDIADVPLLVVDYMLTDILGRLHRDDFLVCVTGVIRK